MGTIIVLILLGVGVVIAIKKMIKDKHSKKSGCGGDCLSCGGHCR